MYRCRKIVLSAVLLATWGGSAYAQTPAEKGQAAVDKALAYMVAQQQGNGSWQRSDREPPAITALVVRSLVRDAKFGAGSDPAKKGIGYLLSIQQKDGGIYTNMIPNYNTAVAVSALAGVDDLKAKEAVEKAVGFLKNAQFNDAGDAKNAQNGGWNYGGQRGGTVDLSNTAMVLDALKESGLKPDDPTYKKAVEFVSKMQNNSETNSSKWAGNDGGFIYNPGKNGEGSSSAGDFTDDHGVRRVRSYGAMSYAGLKSMLYAGLSKDDARVRAAWNWVRSNWTLEENAGLSASKPENAKAGLFYYYYTLARALDVYDVPVIESADGKQSHDWRVELIDKLASAQNADGSFTGTQQYMENNPLIATPLATLALQDALADLKEHPAK